MNDEKTALANQVYETLCGFIEKRNWQFGKNEEELLVHFGISGKDVPMHFVLFVDAERQLIRLSSPLPFKMIEEKRTEGAVAACVASYGMVDGSFDYDLEDGTVAFRMTASFKESLIGEGLFGYMIDCSAATVEKYNDKFLAIDTGELEITDFIASEL